MKARFLLGITVCVLAGPLLAQERRAPRPIAAHVTAGPSALDRGLQQQPAAPPLDIGNAIRAGNWPAAEAAAANDADPLARKLVLFTRLTTPNAGSAAEIAAFAAENPDWPLPVLLERRRQEAIAREGDPAILGTECQRATLTQPGAMLRCAQAMAGTPDGAAFARHAWVAADITDQQAEADFLRRWADALTPADHWARFEALLPGNQAAAIRQIPRLAPSERPLAEARLAVRRGDAGAAALLATLPPELRNNPWLFLDEAVALREAGQDSAALVLWRARGEAAQAAVPTEQRGRFWTERHRFARQLLRTGDATGAYDLAALPGEMGTDQKLDSEFVAGFIALRRLGDPARAIPHFQFLAAVTPAAITQARAWYWIGRAETAAGRDPAAAFAKAAAWPLTFYGQLAAMALGDSETQLAERIRAVREPEVPAELTAQVAAREGMRAARLLMSWGEARRAGAFLARMDELATSPGERTALARLALRMKLADTAVMTARRMGRDGLVLAETGWPMPVTPPAGAVAPAVSLAVMRQESNFDATIVSPAGARGLMQLMPATAQVMAKRLGETTSPVALTTDPAQNMRLGTSYLKDMMERFSALPLAVAAYNAGPHRVQAWLSANGDPRPAVRAVPEAGAAAGTPLEMVDWIELIPFNETRNYVQRVLENVVIYRVRRGEDTPELLAEWKPRSH